MLMFSGSLEAFIELRKAVLLMVTIYYKTRIHIKIIKWNKTHFLLFTPGGVVWTTFSSLNSRQYAVFCALIKGKSASLAGE